MFTSRRVEALRPRIEAITEELLDGMATRGRDGKPIDLIETFAFTTGRSTPRLRGSPPSPYESVT
ncbi:hypothetical protein ABZV93_27290 [Actinopolymorpha sp. NPDC004070]|uniref:hypothetical protein n=1 Tax=Actinopolymorpha sp. NPDC004070 TaxID=3154548 RepID=UPI00339EE0AC